MGEAKRRKQQGRDRVEALRERIAAGEFGPRHDGYLIVLDKSPAGQDTLAALRALGPALAGLPALLEHEALRLWQMSALFRYAVLLGGPGSAQQRSLLATDREQLRARTLPRARHLLSAAGLPCALVLGVEDAQDASLAA